MTERGIPQNLQQELKRIWGEKAYTERMLFGPPLTNEVVHHDPNLSSYTNEASNSNQDANEPSYFIPSPQSTSRILKRRSQPPK